MKQIIKFKTSQKEFPVDEVWGSFIFSYVFIFLLESKLRYNDSNIVIINSSQLDGLKSKISSSLRDLLKVDYNEPSNRDLQKYSTRFEQLFFEGKKYKVNYRMTLTGKIAYAIYCLINFIEDAKLNNNDIFLEYKT